MAAPMHRDSYVWHVQKLKIQTHKRLKRTLFIETRQNQQIVGLIAFVKLQNETIKNEVKR